MQKLYVYRLLVQGFYPMDMSQLGANNTYRFTVTDLNGMIKEELRKQQALFKNALKNPALDKVTKMHLKEMDNMI